MAAPTQTKPGRTLGILLILVLALGAWTFWPGQSHVPKLGLDLRGGTQVILTPVAPDGGSAALTEEQLDQTVSIIRQRVDGLGVAEAEVTTQGSGANASIVVSIPDSTDQTLVDSLKSTAKLDFRPVLAAAAGARTVVPTASPSPSPSGSTKPQPTVTPTNAVSGSPSASGNPAVITGGLLPNADPSGSPSPSASPAASTPPTPGGSPSASATKATDAVIPPLQSKTNDAKFQAAFLALDCSAKDALTGGKPEDPTLYLVTCERDGSAKYLMSPAAVLGVQITNATATPPQQGIGGWQVNLTLNSEGAAAFSKTTGELAAQQPPKNQFGIVLDGLVVSAPSVNEQINGGSAVITGNFSATDAKALANVLKYGALPVQLEVSQVEQISPTLGQDQLTAGLIAGALGLLLVVLYLLFYYRALGLVAVASLLLAAGISYGLFVVLGRQLGFALSLSGVAGAIVAIGITADSFIVYFERIRDEIRDGRTLRVACNTGWIRARRTILAADFVSFLAAVVLYFLSVGSVRGFAFTLGLTTLVDVFVAFLFTYPVVTLFARTRWFSAGGPMTGLDAKRLGVDALPTAATRKRAVTPTTGAAAVVKES